MIHELNLVVDHFSKPSISRNGSSDQADDEQSDGQADDEQPRISADGEL